MQDHRDEVEPVQRESAPRQSDPQDPDRSDDARNESRTDGDVTVAMHEGADRDSAAGISRRDDGDEAATQDADADASTAAVDSASEGIAADDGHAGHADADGDSARSRGVAARFSSWAYAVLFLLVDIAGVGILQWGVTVSSSETELPTPLVGLWSLIETPLQDHRYVFLLNLLVLGALYLTLIFLFNRFWVATPVFVALCLTVSVIGHLKVLSRYETLLPSDFNFLGGGDAGAIASFLPAGAQRTILVVVAIIVVVAALCVLLHRMDLRRGRILTGANRAWGASGRLVGILVPALFLGMFVQSVGTVGAWGNTFAQWMGDIPSMWDSVYDAQRNGALISFARQLNPKIMDMPSDYSEATMRDVVARYDNEAKTINASRNQYMSDNSVVYILSESFSDPTRVPGLSINEDPMPQIRAIKDSTTSGLMLSSGYGGGTANLEFQALTGLSMANFDASLTSPYQQLVPGLAWTPTINQAWGESKNQIALHPYEASMYSRSSNYKKFGFSHFWTRSGPEFIAHQHRIDNSPYISDQSAYDSTIEKIEGNSAHQFVQLVTMQNHMPFNNWYNDNQFTATATPGAKALGSNEAMSIETYAKGMNHTDAATKQFLDELDAQKKPITVVFYGDHLPGVYTTAGANKANSIALHETDYFIWSNAASSTRGTKIADSAYTSPNFFMAQMADHMNAKVSPYIAFLTKMHSKIAAMEPPVVNQIQGWARIPAGQTIYLDGNGNPMAERDFDATTKQLLHDYQLIQYDITAGSHYLQNSDFMTVPSSTTASTKQSKYETTAKQQTGETASGATASGATTSKDAAAQETSASERASGLLRLSEGRSDSVRVEGQTSGQLR